MNNGLLMWGALDNLIYVPLVIIAVCILMYRVVRWNRVVHSLATLTQFKRVVHHASLTKQIIKALLLGIGLIFIFLALLNPQWDKKETVVAQEGRDLFIALDISRSMLAQDCKPNRLACAKQKIKSLLKKLSCERVGLVLFSGSTFVQCPLTSDYAAFYMFLDQIDVETISSGTTALDQAIAQVIAAFRTSGERKNKLLLLFTDGEDFSSNLKQVKCDAAQEGMKIFTMGIGTAEGAPIPVVDEHGNQIGHQRDAKNAIVISRLNEGILRNVAAECGGVYIPMTADESDIKSIVGYIDRFEKEKLDDKKVSLFQEQYPYCAMVSFACLIVEWIL